MRRALAEDLGWGDVTTEAIVPSELRARGIILAKSPCVIAGLDVAAEAFRSSIPASRVRAHVTDGDALRARATSSPSFSGQAAAMLTAERTALNFLQRLSRHRDADAPRSSTPPAGRITVLDTRKTTPTLRALEKYAVRAGGGTNHRAGLDDGDPDQGQPRAARRRRRAKPCGG